MLRITIVSDSQSEVTLRVEGRIISDWVSELERETMSFLQSNRLVILDFQDVKFVDGKGVEMLRWLVAGNVEITNAPPLIKDLLKEEDE